MRVCGVTLSRQIRDEALTSPAGQLSENKHLFLQLLTPPTYFRGGFPRADSHRIGGAEKTGAHRKAARRMG